MAILLKNGTIYQGAGTFCEALAVSGGRITASGSLQEVEALVPDARVIDLQGAFVCPGFHDSHMHVLSYGRLLGGVSLAGKRSLEEVMCALRDGLRDVPQGEWLVAKGWNDDYFLDVRRFPNRRDLDEVSSDVPIMASRICGHVCVLNSRALAIAGIDANTSDPAGGVIDRDEDGEPTGVLRENAMELAEKAQPLPNYKVVKSYLRRAIDSLVSFGITAVQTDDFSCFTPLAFEAVLRAYSELEDEGALKVRVYEQVNLPTVKRLDAFLETGLRTGSGTDFFRIGPLKLLADGSLGARTAYLREEYDDEPGSCGVAIYTQKQMDALIAKAVENGMQIAVHAIGDAALAQVLEAMEKAGVTPAMRDGIVHAQITANEQLETMRRMGILAYVQPIFLDYDTRIVESRVGEKRSASSYAFGTLARWGLASFGTDCPVETPNPLAGIQCAVTRAPRNAPQMRMRPEEALTVREAIDAYSAGSAYACFAEDRLGLLREGMAADFTILESDPMQAYPSRIGDIRVLETWMNGKCTYSALRGSN